MKGLPAVDVGREYRNSKCNSLATQKEIPRNSESYAGTVLLDCVYAGGVLDAVLSAKPSIFSPFKACPLVNTAQTRRPLRLNYDLAVGILRTGGSIFPRLAQALSAYYLWRTSTTPVGGSRNPESFPDSVLKPQGFAVGIPSSTSTRTSLLITVVLEFPGGIMTHSCPSEARASFCMACR